MALANGIKAIAITDHDNTGSYAGAVEAAKDIDLEIIPGIEINTWYNTHEVHVLGYYIDPDDAGIQAVCKEHNCQRERQM
jgi:predicted metal-dependent phosphoesterase TrpH